MSDGVGRSGPTGGRTPQPLRALVPASVARLESGRGVVPPGADRGAQRLLSAPGAAALPAGLVPVEHPATPTDSFDALYAPAHVLVGPTAFAVHFLELVRPLLFPDPAVNFAEYVRRYPNGLTFRVELHGNGKLGLPTVFDYDVLFAVFHLAAERGVSEQGMLVGVTFRDLARAVGWSDAVYGGSRHRAIKTALARWAALSIATNVDLAGGAGAAGGRGAAEARDGRARPHAVDALPRRVLPKLRWYDVLKYGVDTLAAAGADEDDETGAELLGAIRIEPVWLDLVASGYTAWIDREFHASLDERYAKRLYEVLLVRALRVPAWGAPEPWALSVAELLEELGAPVASGQAGRVRRTVVGKLPMLEAAGVVGAWREIPGRGDRHRVELWPGERLLAARSCAGLRMHERPELARLVWALQHGPWAFAPAEARHAAESRPAAALRVLQYATWLCARGWEPRRSWGGWVKDAIREEWRFDGDLQFQAWLAVRQAGHRVPAWIDVRRRSAAELATELATELAGSDAAGALATATGAAPAALALPGASATEAPLARPTLERPDAPSTDAEPAGVAGDPPVDGPTGVWGEVRRALRATVPATTFASWLAPLVLVQAPEAGDAEGDDAVLVLQAPYEFSADWVARKWGDAIAALATDALGRPVTVRVLAERGVAGPPVERDGTTGETRQAAG